MFDPRVFPPQGPRLLLILFQQGRGSFAWATILGLLRPFNLEMVIGHSLDGAPKKKLSVSGLVPRDPCQTISPWQGQQVSVCAF